jgi:hypothetical protein
MQRAWTPVMPPHEGDEPAVAHRRLHCAVAVTKCHYVRAGSGVTRGASPSRNPMDPHGCNLSYCFEKELSLEERTSNVDRRIVRHCVTFLTALKKSYGGTPPT